MPLPPKKSWRDIEQTSRPKKITYLAQRRVLGKLLKFTCFSFFCGLFIIIIGYLVYSTDGYNRWTDSQRTSLPVRHVSFDTDGVLTKDWLNKVVSINKEESLLGIDHFAIKKTLESFGQIQSASISKLFPDTLRVILKERNPILRVRVATGNGKSVDLLVAEDGMVYKGNAYSPFQLQGLPFLETTHLYRSGDKIKPLKGMNVVASLLAYARLYLPNMYKSWRVISCKKFSGDTNALGAYIIARSDWVDEIIFAPMDFERQFFALTEIINYYSQKNLQRIQQIDLSLTQPVIRFHSNL